MQHNICKYEQNHRELIEMKTEKNYQVVKFLYYSGLLETRTKQKFPNKTLSQLCC